MKKFFILTMTAAIAAIGCSKTIEVAHTPETPISFGTWANVLTKARTPGANTFVSGDDFAVYGFTTKSNSVYTPVFDDVVVSYDGTDWTYGPTRFWDQSADQYTFFAVSPASAGTDGVVNPQSGEITSASFTFAGNDNDILVADKKEVLKAHYGNNVEIQFNHIASLVDFKVKKHQDLGDATVAITSFSLSNIDNTGTFSVSADYPNSHPDVAWGATAHTGSYSNLSGVNPVETLPTDIGTEGDLLINHLVAMPQQFRTGSDSQKVSVDYTITDEAGNVSTYTKSFELNLFDTVDDTDNADTLIPGWDDGKHYTFYITINANAITFSASIVDWVTTGANGYNYLVQ